VPAVELSLDVRHDLDPVDHEAGDQAVDFGVLNDDADQPGSAQVALAELRADEILVDASHADSVTSPFRSHGIGRRGCAHQPRTIDSLFVERRGPLSLVYIGGPPRRG
jgi:hypothetical protein